MNYSSILILIFCLSVVPSLDAQVLPRTFGARAFACDDGTTSGMSLTYDVNGPLTRSYSIHWPGTPPTADLSYCVIDASGNMWWTEYGPLPALDAGNIWCGNSLNVAEPMAPGPVGSIL